MNNLNKRGFTLVELIATLVVLSLVMGIGSYAITSVIKSNKEKNYQLLVNEIKDAVSKYRMECKYADTGSIDCNSQVSLGKLVEYGFLSSNNAEDNTKVVNPNDKTDITNCIIKYSYNNGVILVEAVNPFSGCPTNY